jgi:hypothetical protein
MWLASSPVASVRRLRRFLAEDAGKQLNLVLDAT